MSTTARDVMTEGAECVSENDTVATAAQRMASLDVGALPICGADDSLEEARRTMEEHQVRRLPSSTATAWSAW